LIEKVLLDHLAFFLKKNAVLIEEIIFALNFV